MQITIKIIKKLIISKNYLIYKKKTKYYYFKKIIYITNKYKYSAFIFLVSKFLFYLS